jgi:hypothetical protein
MDGCEVNIRGDANHCGACTDLDDPEADFRCADGEECIEFNCVGE